MTEPTRATDALLPGLGPESIEDLYDRAPCGYLVTLVDGTIVRMNQRFLDWTGRTRDQLVGRRFTELLGVGGRIFHETHVAPLLALQPEVRDLAFDVVRADGRVMPVLVNVHRVDETGSTGAHHRVTVFDASQRHEYESELLRARKAAEASEAQVRAVATTLQQSLMSGSLDAGPGFRIETRYRPAVEALEVGGDWHDAFLLPDGVTVAISVGDVVGRGIRAACAMGQLRAAVRAIAISEIGPGAVLDHLDVFVERLPDARLATLAYAELDTSTGQVRYACAGHLPPLVLEPGGAARYLWEGRSRPVGSATEPRPEASTTIPAGSRVLLYTDGLIERRARGIDDGLQALEAAAVASPGEDLAALADRLMDELLEDEEHRDDVCLLCHQHDGPS